MATLFLSQGVPMLLSGDEMGNTQRGNNNAYCQDNAITWLDWEHADKSLFNFCKNIIQLYKKHPVFSRRKWFQGKEVRNTGLNDIMWMHPSGTEMQAEDWQNGWNKSITVYLNGQGIEAIGYEEETIIDDCFLLLFNAYENDLVFKVPEKKGNHGRPWKKVVDTVNDCIKETGCAVYKDGDEIKLEGRSMIVLRRDKAPQKT